MYLDGFDKFLKIFVQKYMFLPFLKEMDQKHFLGGNFSKMQLLAQKLMIWIDFPWNSLSIFFKFQVMIKIFFTESYKIASISPL